MKKWTLSLLPLLFSACQLLPFAAPTPDPALIATLQAPFCRNPACPSRPL